MTPVAKTERIVASSLEGASPRYPGKIEGLSLTADGKLFMINDNDFGIAGDPTDHRRRRGQRHRPALGAVLCNTREPHPLIRSGAGSEQPPQAALVVRGALRSSLYP